MPKFDPQDLLTDQQAADFGSRFDLPPEVVRRILLLKLTYEPSGKTQKKFEDAAIRRIIQHEFPDTTITDTKIYCLWLDDLCPHMRPKNDTERDHRKTRYHLSDSEKMLLLEDSPEPNLPGQEQDEQGSGEEHEREDSREQDRQAPVTPVELPQVHPPAVSAPSGGPSPGDDQSLSPDDCLDPPPMKQLYSSQQHLPHPPSLSSSILREASRHPLPPTQHIPQPQSVLSQPLHTSSRIMPPPIRQVSAPQNQHNPSDTSSGYPPAPTQSFGLPQNQHNPPSHEEKDPKE